MTSERAPRMERIVEGKRYSTRTSTLLASDRYWDGSNWERSGRNCYLYVTPRGRYFKREFGLGG